MNEEYKPNNLLDYLQATYQNKPITDYPNQLAQYLFNRLHLNKGSKLCEIGCGRGEFLTGFKKAGCAVCGTDICISSIQFNDDVDVCISVLGKEPLPFADNTFDVVFSKSLLEHLPGPEYYMTEALRILKPGGFLVTMTPDWESCLKTFFDDYTHVRPYTVISLQIIHDMFGCDDIHIEKFYQLPAVWSKPYLKYLCRTIAPFIPLRNVKNKFLRWSRELMLLAIAKKPSNN